MKANLSEIENYLLNKYGINENNVFTEKSLKYIFYAINDLCFTETYLHKINNEWNVTFSWSNRLTSSAANIRLNRKNREAKISMSRYIFTNFKPGLKTNGLTCYTRMQGIINVMQHEMAHIHESGHGNRFKNLVYLYFGHTDTVHSFETKNSKSRGLVINEKQENFKIGDRVYFFHKNVRIEGVINNLVKNAIIKINNLKYSVPQELLFKVEM